MNTATVRYQCGVNEPMIDYIKQNEDKIRGSLATSMSSRAEVSCLTHHNLFLEKMEGVLYAWLEDKTQKMVAVGFHYGNNAMWLYNHCTPSEG
jgi:hypothetical protein